MLKLMGKLMQYTLKTGIGANMSEMNKSLLAVRNGFRLKK
jgi:hypothetical protein